MIIKHTIGNSVYLGGRLEEIEPINFSLYNFNNKFNSDLQEISPNFYYFLTTEEDYVYARAKNMQFNWKYSNPDGSFTDRYKRTKMVKKLAAVKAKQEFDSIPEERFISNNQHFSSQVYTFGDMPSKLDGVNYSDFEVKTEKIQVSEETKTEKTI
jgi:hypothetical protein